MDMLVYRRQIPDLVETSRVHAWLEACYSQVYGLPADDERIHTMMQEMPATTHLI
jgi:hypothetical protein